MKRLTTNGVTHAEELLLVAAQRTRKGIWFMPQSLGSERCAALPERVLVYGGGSASALRGLERRGLITFEHRLGQYACQATDAGLKRADEIIAALPRKATR